jgi:hypothetical protein
MIAVIGNSACVVTLVVHCRAFSHVSAYITLFIVTLRSLLICGLLKFGSGVIVLLLLLNCLMEVTVLGSWQYFLTGLEQFSFIFSSSGNCM